MQFITLPERLGGILIPIAISATTVAVVTITDMIWPEERAIGGQKERVAGKSSSERVCSEGSSAVFHPNVYAFLLEEKALPVPGPTIVIDCNGKTSIGIYP